MGLTHRLKPGDTIRVGEHITFHVLAGSYGTNIKVDVDAPRDSRIAIEKTPREGAVSGALARKARQM